MPEIGEVTRGRFVGKNGNHPYVWKACEVCGKERWFAYDYYTGLPSRCCSGCRSGMYNGNNATGWKGGRYKEKAGYVVVYLSKDDFFYAMTTRTRGKPSHVYGGYVQEHRLVMAKSLGRCLQPWEKVHHKNGIRDDNRIENLELFEGLGSHIKEHNGGYRDGFNRGRYDGRLRQIQELKERISRLESELNSLTNVRKGITE